MPTLLSARALLNKMKCVSGRTRMCISRFVYAVEKKTLTRWPVGWLVYIPQCPVCQIRETSFVCRTTRISIFLTNEMCNLLLESCEHSFIPTWQAPSCARKLVVLRPKHCINFVSSMRMCFGNLTETTSFYRKGKSPTPDFLLVVVLLMVRAHYGILAQDRIYETI